MPQIIPGSTNPPAPVASPPSWGGDNSNNANPWGWNQPGQMQGQEKRLTPQERVEMIEKVYQEILNRKPDTRDINYYKYSTLSEEEIRKQLIAGKEHKQLLDDGKDYKKMKDRAMQAETRVNMLESQIKDQVEEFRHLTELLTEKNQYIQQLRQKLNNPYNLVDNRPAVVAPVVEPVLSPSIGNQVYAQPVETTVPKVRHTAKSRILDIIKNIIPD